MTEGRRVGGSRRRGVEELSASSYYGVPTVHKPHWGWVVIAYFYCGGLSAGAFLLASIADLVGGPRVAAIVRAGRYISFAALLPCPPLLIADLGRPERFLYMLRVLKLRSPMSAGVWALLSFSGVCGLTAVAQAARDGWLPSARAARLPTRALSLLGLGPALFVGSYTGVLLAATAVPLWTRSYLFIGPLFLTSAISNALAAIALVLSAAPGDHRVALQRLQRLERVALPAELALALALRSRLSWRVARPIDRGQRGLLCRGGVIGAGLLGPWLLQTFGNQLGLRERVRTVLASVLVVVGGVLLRYVLVSGGQESADDPQAAFEVTRLAADQPVAAGAPRAPETRSGPPQAESSAGV